MLPLQNRLKNKKDVQEVFRKGFFIGGKLASLKIINRKDRDPSKFCFTVGKREASSKPKKNRIIRRLREVVRFLLKEDKIKEGFYIVILGKKNVIDAEFADLQKNIICLFEKANLLK